MCASLLYALAICARYSFVEAGFFQHTHSPKREHFTVLTGRCRFFVVVINNMQMICVSVCARDARHVYVICTQNICVSVCVISKIIFTSWRAGIFVCFVRAYVDFFIS